MTLGIVLTALACAGLLAADRREWRAGRWLFKPLASLGFVLAAVRAPAVALPAGGDWLLLAGLALSAAGDVLLIPRGKTTFIAGIGAFALAHVTYGAWFLGHGTTAWVLAPVVAGFMIAGHLAWLWIDPHVTGALRLPVRGYVALVSLMAACALAYGIGARGGPQALLPAFGGLLFYLSDLSVARDRFVKRSFENKAWGLPVYYAAQLLIAAAVV